MTEIVCLANIMAAWAVGYVDRDSPSYLLLLTSIVILLIKISNNLTRMMVNDD